MQRTCADMNSPFNESAELTQGALQVIHYSEVVFFVLNIFLMNKILVFRFKSIIKTVYSSHMTKSQIIYFPRVKHLLASL
jgi:hypothetical protein